MPDKNKIREEVQGLFQQLETGIAELYKSDQYQKYLDCLAKFPKYSLNNTLLIYRQMPNATLVAGFKKWKNDFERSVRKGQKGIRIFAPIKYRPKEKIESFNSDTVGDSDKIISEDVEKEVLSFRPISVFDVSQTEGKPLPQLAKDLFGDVAEYSILLKALENISPFPISFTSLPEGVDGLCSSTAKEIYIRQDMSEKQTISTVIHELVHATLHHAKYEEVDPSDENEKTSPNENRSIKEIEAESVAYVVCKHLAIETKDNSFGYIANWGDGKEIAPFKELLKNIHHYASDFIAKIDFAFEELYKEHENALSAQEQSTEQAYDLGFGHLGNGVTVWNRLEEKNGDYLTLAHINADRTVTFYEKGLPEEVREQIATEAEKMEMSISATQDQSVFSSDKVLPLPDSSLSISEMNLYGYTSDEILPLSKKYALALFDEEQSIYLLYPNGQDVLVFDREEIEEHEGMYGITTADWKHLFLAQKAVETSLVKEKPSILRDLQKGKEAVQAQNEKKETALSPRNQQER